MSHPFLYYICNIENKFDYVDNQLNAKAWSPDPRGKKEEWVELFLKEEEVKD